MVYVLPKVFFFLAMAGSGCVYPFLSLYCSQILGLNTFQIGIIGAIMPLSCFFFTTSWSLMADKYGIHRKILVVNSFISGASLLMFPMLSMMIPASSDGIKQPTTLHFLAALGIMAFYSIIQVPISPLIDTAVLDILGEDGKAFYGQQRLVGSFSYGLMGFVVGELMRYDSAFALQMIFYGNFAFVSILLVLALVWPTEWHIPSFSRTSLYSKQIDVDHSIAKSVQIEAGLEESRVEPSAQQPAPMSLIKSVKALFEGNASIWRFWSTAIIIGFCSTVINSFVFLMVVDVLGGEKSVIGVTSFARISLEIPTFYFSAWLISTFGSNRLQQFALVLMTVRMMLYSLMLRFRWNAWLDVPIEMIHGIVN